MSYVAPVTDATYRARVIDSLTPVLLVFLDNDSEARRAFTPVLSETARQLGDNLLVATAETATNPDTAQRWGVTRTPTAVLLHYGIMQRVLLGVRPAERLIEEIRQALGPDFGTA
ncbi:thioredoxin domain-containing protein [Actinoplanes sp. NPDC049118]|uniref:thioredoxin family protein n=1 Tax=Actinoplanes sp. NPDC049118 TaxID=3155769 RepID=UPI00340ADF24